MSFLSMILSSTAKTWNCDSAAIPILEDKWIEMEEKGLWNESKMDCLCVCLWEEDEIERWAL